MSELTKGVFAQADRLNTIANNLGESQKGRNSAITALTAMGKAFGRNFRTPRPASAVAA